MTAGSFSWDDVVRGTATENASRALSGFEREFSIPQLMDAEDIVTTPDDKGMQLYLSYVIDSYNKKFGYNPGTPYVVRAHAGQPQDGPSATSHVKEPAKSGSRVSALKVPSPGHSSASSTPNFPVQKVSLPGLVCAKFFTLASCVSFRAVIPCLRLFRKKEDAEVKTVTSTRVPQSVVHEDPTIKAKVRISRDTVRRTPTYSLAAASFFFVMC
jgi:hypothetical protein